MVLECEKNEGKSIKSGWTFVQLILYTELALLYFPAA